MFSKYVFIVLVASYIQFTISTEIGNSSTRLLSRRKRYVAFPEGSSISVAGCVTVGVIGQPAPTTNPGTFSFSLNWAIAYELPNVTETTAYYLQKKYKHSKKAHQRRSRRDLYERLEIILKDMGYNGRDCILKALCETTQRIVPHGPNMVEEVFRTLFTMPITKMVTSEPLEHAVYTSAQRLGTLLENCDSMFNCPLSLVDWAKGYYNAPSPNSETLQTYWPLFSNVFV